MGIDPSIGPDRAREVFRAELAEVRTDAALQLLRTRWIGRNHSWIAAFMEALKSAPPEQKKALGKGANELKKEVEKRVTELDEDPFDTPVDLGDVIAAAKELRPEADVDWS